MVVLQNTLGPAGPVAVTDAIVDLLLPAGPAPIPTAFAGDLASLAGVYQGPSRGRLTDVEVTVEAGVLRAAMNGSDEAQPLMHIGAGVFTADDDPWGPRTWFVDGSGKILGAGGSGDPVQLHFDHGGGHYVLRRQPGG